MDGLDPSAGGIFLYQSGPPPHIALFPGRPRTGANRGPGGAVRCISRARGLDEVVFGGCPALRIFEERREIHRTLWHAAGVHLQPRRVERGPIPRAGLERRQTGRNALLASVPGLVRFSRQQRNGVVADEGALDGGTDRKSVV